MKITTKHRSRLFTMAHFIRSQFDSFAQALAHAWRVIRLYAKMQTSNVRFKYRKVSGEVREAVGTLSAAMEVKGTGRPTPADSVLYYDCEAQGWRSFKVCNLV